MNRRRSPESDAPLAPDKALGYALRALAQKALTERELSDRLRRRGASPEVLARTLESLRDYGFVDDAGLAERAARDERQGPLSIRAKLKARGVDEHTIEDALSGRDPELDLEGARALVERHRSRWVGERAYSKAYAFLARRGYPSSVIFEALEPIRAASPGEPELEDED